MTDYNARFRQAAADAKLNDEVNKFIYSTSLPEPIRAQLESKLRADGHENGDPLAKDLFTLETLMSQVLTSEYLLRQNRRMSQAASSSSSLHRGAGYHHTSAHQHEIVPAPSSFDSAYLQGVQHEIMNASVAELNAMAATGRQPFRPNDRQRSSPYSSSRDSRRGGNNQYPRTAPQQEGGYNQNSTGAPRPPRHASRSPHPSRPSPQSASYSASEKQHPALTRGRCELSAEDVQNYTQKARDAQQKYEWLRRLDFTLLMCRVKQSLCYGCGMRTSADHTTDSCRGKQYLK